MNNPQENLSPIVFTIDRSFILPLRNALKSLSKVHTGAENIDVIVLFTNELDRKDIDVLYDAVASNQQILLRLQQVPLLVEGVGESAEINHAAYLRLAIASIFDVEQVVYLDADIFFTKSPVDLLRLQLEGQSAIAAVQDVQNPTLESGIAIPGWQSLGLKGNTPYFNSGVMVMSIKKWNEEKISEQAIDFVQSHPQHLRFRDQDALNFLLVGKWQSLPLIWNYPPLSVILKIEGAKYYAEKISPLNSILDIEQDAGIIHFVGPAKPWQQGFPDGNVTDLYRELTK